MLQENDKPKKATKPKKAKAETPIEIYGLEPLPEKQVTRHEWSSEIDVCEFIGALIKMHGAQRVLEIGVFEGEASIKMIEALPIGGYYAGVDVTDYRKYNLNRDGIKVDFILKDSISALKEFPRSHFDFIYVDGDHIWNTIHKEFKEIIQVISKNGVIAYHDSIHMNDIKQLMRLAVQYKFNVITLNTSEGRGLSILKR
jgi:predicted O-methyltransferase YrrM